MCLLGVHLLYISGGYTALVSDFTLDLLFRFVNKNTESNAQLIILFLLSSSAPLTKLGTRESSSNEIP